MGTGVGGGGETIVGTTPTGTGRGEGGGAMAALGFVTAIDSNGEGRVTKGTVEVGGVTPG